ncbi:MAG: hypothetical protein H0W20_03860 [Chthoniobacterales bacterium]|nr:hypothetical protein [Chthoniobacterales bacterium]
MRLNSKPTSYAISLTRRFGFKSTFFAFSSITNVILARILVLFVVVGVLEILALTS